MYTAAAGSASIMDSYMPSECVANATTWTRGVAMALRATPHFVTKPLYSTRS